MKRCAEEAAFAEVIERRQGGEPGDGTLGLLHDGGVGAVGGDYAFGEPPEIFAGHLL